MLFVRGYNLEDHLHENGTVPQYIYGRAGVNEPNPDYSKYVERDSSLASWILAYVSYQISRGLIGCMTATSTWQKLHRDFPSSSTMQIMHLYDHLKVQKLSDQSMRDYLTNIQSVCDILASCGHPIEEMQHMSIILNGAKGQYDNVIAVIHASRNPYDIASVSV